MIGRFVGGPLDGRDFDLPEDLARPKPFCQIPPGFDDPGIYVLEPVRTWGPTAEDLGLDPDLDDEYYRDLSDDELADYYPEVVEGMAALEAAQMIARTFKGGHHVIFYRYQADVNQPWQPERRR